jgi:hypothetical protein
MLSRRGKVCTTFTVWPEMRANGGRGIICPGLRSFAREPSVFRWDCEGRTEKWDGCGKRIGGKENRRRTESEIWNESDVIGPHFTGSSPLLR